jgi:hypothetical protein
VLQAPHGAGTVDIGVRVYPEHVQFTVANISDWTGSDPVEKHLARCSFFNLCFGLEDLKACPSGVNLLIGSTLNVVKTLKAFGQVKTHVETTDHPATDYELCHSPR